MPTVERFDTKADVAEAAARGITSQLSAAIERRGEATWVIAGGTSPTDAYTVIAEKYFSEVDWSKVTFIIGDERCVPDDDPDSNWLQAHNRLLHLVAGSSSQRPPTSKPADEAADAYSALLKTKTDPSGRLEVDVAWLGLGEDGHTLSLFPGRSEIGVLDRLVIPIYDSPKPPPSRITLTLSALKNARDTTIFGVGGGKADVIATALGDEQADLPIAVTSRFIESNGGAVTWLLDDAGASKLAHR